MIFENHSSTLYFDGCNTIDLAHKYGTPLMLVSETAITNKCIELRENFTEKYPNCRVAYAAKAFLSIALCKILESENMCIDVVSGGELFTCIAAGFPGERIEFNGNNKSEIEINMAIDYKVGRIIVDNTDDFLLVNKIASSKKEIVNILFRITPEVNIDSHEYISTGQKDSKFGVPLDEDVFYPLIESAIGAPYINFLGFHFHVGSQLFDNQPHIKSTIKTLTLVKELKKRYDYDTKEINIGGGFGIRYTVDDTPAPYSYFIEPIMDLVYDTFNSLQIEEPSVVIEPGRSLIGEGGITLYTVGNIKEIPNVRKYVSVDGGMTDNIRPSLYNAKYEGAVANKFEQSPTENVTICGKCCESGDILIKDISIPSVEKGDIFAVFSTGAYCFSMASNYNKNLLPAVVMVKHGHSRVIINRQTYKQLIEREIE